MEREDIVRAIAEYHEDMNLAVAEIALDYAVQRRMEDMAHKHVQDSSVYYGRVTRAGPFKYEDGWKNKDYNNLKPLFQKTSHLPIFGSTGYGSHNENSPNTHLIGFSTDWEYDDKNEDIYGKQYFFDDVKNLSALKKPVELPVSIRFDDAGHGNQQILTGLHHLAVSLNKLEDDRCGLEGGKACTISPVGDYIKPMEATEIAEGSIADAEDTASSDNKTGYQKLKKSEISEATDMTDKKKTSPGAGKPTPNKNEIGTYVEKCADGEQTEEECKMQQKREERTGKWDGEVSGKMGKDLEELDITLEDLTALIKENDDLRTQMKDYIMELDDNQKKLEETKKETSDLESKVDKLIKWQEKALNTEKERQDGELETLKKDLVDNHSICDKFIENHDTYDFLTEFHKGLPHEEKDDLAEDEIDGVIPTSLADMGKKLEDMKEEFAYMKMS